MSSEVKLKSKGETANLIASWSAVNKLHVSAPQLAQLLERLGYE